MAFHIFNAQPDMRIIFTRLAVMIIVVIIMIMMMVVTALHPPERHARSTIDNLQIRKTRTDLFN